MRQNTANTPDERSLPVDGRAQRAVVAVHGASVVHELAGRAVALQSRQRNKTRGLKPEARHTEASGTRSQATSKQRNINRASSSPDEVAAKQGAYAVVLARARLRRAIRAGHTCMKNSVNERSRPDISGPQARVDWNSNRNKDRNEGTKQPMLQSEERTLEDTVGTEFAKAAGLAAFAVDQSFLVRIRAYITDHNQSTRRREAPQIRHGCMQTRPATEPS